MRKFVPVMKKEDLPPDSIRRVAIKDHELVVLRVKDDIFVLDDCCSHEDYPLSNGFIDDGLLCCSMHGAKFDPKTGEPQSLPAYERVRTYAVRLRNNIVEIEMEVRVESSAP